MTVSTKNVGSECKVDLGYTKEEWDNLRNDVQDDIIHEKLFDTVNICIEEK